MMLERLRSKHTPALNLFFFTLKKSLPLMLLSLAFMALVNPGLLLSWLENTLVGYPPREPVDLSEMTTVIGIGTTAATAALSMLFCLINFSYLYKKPAGDVFHALPISRTKLLLSRYFASVLPALAPALLSYVSLSLVCLSDRVIGDYNYIWSHAALNLGIVLVMSAMTMVFLVCAGNTFSFVASLGGLNVGIPVLLYIGIELCENYLHGYVADYNAIYYCTPAFFAFSRYQLYDQGWDAYWLQLPWLLLIAAVCLLAAVLLYNRRKSEKSGETYAFKFVYYIVSVLLSIIGAFAVGFIFGDGSINMTFWVFALVGGVLTAIAFGALTDKGFKTVKRSAILGGCAYVLLLVFTFGIILDITGYEKRIPQAEDVREVTVSVPYGDMPDVVLSDAKDVVALHEAVLDPYWSETSYTGGTVEFTYELKSGAIMKRRYNLQTEKAQIAYYKLLLNKEYQQQIIKPFEDLGLDPAWNASYGVDYYGVDKEASIQISKEEAIRILTLYYEELEAVGVTRHLNHTFNDSIYLHGFANKFIDGDIESVFYESANMSLSIDGLPRLQAYIAELVDGQTVDVEK